MGVYAVGNVAACGSSSDRRDIAPVDGAVDASPDSGPPPCSYTEHADTTNDPDAASGPLAEATALTVGGAPQTLCGKIDTGHFNPDTNSVDVDAYRVTVDAAADLIVRFEVAAGAPPLEVSVFVFDTADAPALLFGAFNNPDVRDHGAFLISLPPGTFDVVVRAGHDGDLAAPVDYQVQLAPDPPSRCPAVTAAAAYSEAHDGDGDRGNDVLSVDFARDPAYQLTATTSDAAEPTGLTIEGSTAIRITGSSADVSPEDDYIDRDTYLVRTGAATRELTLRLDWTDEHDDLDIIVLPAAPSPLRDIAKVLHVTGRENYNVVAVNPATDYWIWVGGRGGSTALPATYDLSICGTSTFAGGAR